MNSSITDLENEIYGMRVENILGAFEYDVQVKVNASIELMLERVDALVAAGILITDADLERVTAPVNDVLQTELGQAMVDTQSALRDLAAERDEVTPVAPFFTAVTLLRQAEMDGKSMADWFNRRSPSGWKQGVVEEIRKGIDAGWESQRNVVSQVSKRLAAIALETGLWSHATRTLGNNWVSGQYRHVTRQDELVCDRCGPLNGKIFSWATDSPTVHPRCRCIGVAVPVATG